MKEKMKAYSSVISLSLYAVLTTVCGCLSGIFPDYRALIFWIWYMITAAIWFGLAITAIVLLVKLWRINKLKKKMRELDSKLRKMEDDFNL